MKGIQLDHTKGLVLVLYALSLSSTAGLHVTFFFFSPSKLKWCEQFYQSVQLLHSRKCCARWAVHTIPTNWRGIVPQKYSVDHKHPNGSMSYNMKVYRDWLYMIAILYTCTVHVHINLSNTLMIWLSNQAITLINSIGSLVRNFHIEFHWLVKMCAKIPMIRSISLLL